MALSINASGNEYYVYTLDGDYTIYHPTQKEVPDVKITGEVWIKEPVKIKMIGKIKVIGDSGKDGLKYKYNNGNSTAELYEWDYKWVSD
jgi:hypothetical protein